MQNVLYHDDLHEHEGSDGVWSFLLLPGDLKSLKRIFLVQRGPHLADRAESLSPFCFVEPKFLSAHSRKLLELGDHSSTVESLDTAVNIRWQSKEGRSIEFRHLVYHTHIVPDVRRLRHWDHAGQWLLSLQNLVFEDSLDIRSENSNIELVVDPSSINGIFQNTEDLLPLSCSTFGLGVDCRQGELAGFEIAEGELIVLAPSLRNVFSTFLNQSVEPGQNKQELSVLDVLRWGHIIECSLQIVSNSRRGLVCNLQARLEQNRREFSMRLTGKPESELFVWSKQFQLFFKTWKPRRDQMQVLEAYPLTFLSRTPYKLDSNLILATTHGELVEGLPSDHGLGKVRKLATWIGTWSDDE